MVGAVDSLKSFVDDNRDSSIDWTPLLVPAPPPPPPLPVPMMLLLILCGAPPINDPFSEVPLFRDWARCFFKLASVVPACDWSKLWVSREKNRFHRKEEIFLHKLWVWIRMSVCVCVHHELWIKSCNFNRVRVCARYIQHISEFRRYIQFVSVEEGREEKREKYFQLNIEIKNYTVVAYAVKSHKNQCVSRCALSHALLPFCLWSN